MLRIWILLEDKKEAAFFHVLELAGPVWGIGVRGLDSLVYICVFLILESTELRHNLLIEVLKVLLFAFICVYVLSLY